MCAKRVSTNTHVHWVPKGSVRTQTHTDVHWVTDLGNNAFKITRKVTFEMHVFNTTILIGYFHHFPHILGKSSQSPISTAGGSWQSSSPSAQSQALTILKGGEERGEQKGSSHSELLHSLVPLRYCEQQGGSSALSPSLPHSSLQHYAWEGQRGTQIPWSCRRNAGEAGGKARTDVRAEGTIDFGIDR